MKRVLTCLVLAGVALSAAAAQRPFQASLVPDVAICDQADTINGLALSIWGANEQHALAFGIINGSFWHSGGLSLGCVNYAEDYTGAQLAFLNIASGHYTGLQAGWLNYTTDVCTGFQLAFVNYAGRLSGVQLGFVNMAAQTDTGLQVGLINLITENRRWFTGLPDQLAPVMVFVNWRL